MSTHKIQVHFLVLTVRRKELFLQLALRGFRPKRPELRHEAAENLGSGTKRQISSSRPMSSPDRRPRVPGFEVQGLNASSSMRASREIPSTLI
jgi:hypothetical protein